MIEQFEPYYDSKEANAIAKYISSGGWGTEYQKTREYEEKIAKFLGTKYCCMTTSGTMALILALVACEVEEGDKVIVPSYSMVATANAVRLIGGEPVFVDVDEHLCLDADLVEKEIPKRVKAVVYVSFNGRAGKLEKVKQLCKKFGTHLIEDACQSFSSKHNGRYLGTFGKIGCFSLSPYKIMSTGQGGFLVTNNKQLYKEMKSMKDWGRVKGGVDIHKKFWINAKYTDFQALIGLEQLKRVPRRAEARARVFKRYLKNLDGLVRFIPTRSGVIPMFTDIYAEDRDILQHYLLRNNIKTRQMYLPIHRQMCYNLKGLDLPNTDWYSERGLWLPSSPALSNRDIDFISEEIEKFYAGTVESRR